MGGGRRKPLCAAAGTSRQVLPNDVCRLTCGSRSTRPPISPIRPRHGAGRIWCTSSRGLSDVAGHQVMAPSDFRSDVEPGDGRRRAALERKAAKHAIRLVATYRDLPSVARPEAWAHLPPPPHRAGPHWPRRGGDTGHSLSAGGRILRARGKRRRSRELALVRGPCHRAGAGGALPHRPGRREHQAPDCAYHAALSAGPLPRFRTLSGGRAGRAPVRRSRRCCRSTLPRPWLLAAAPMRPGAPLASWRLLGRSLGLIAAPPWQLLAVGDGEVRALVEDALAPLGVGRAVFAGARRNEALRAAYTACDLYAWPAYQEALSLAVLEAAAAGLPVVAQDWPGPAAVVAHGESGFLTPRNDDVAFAGAVVDLSTNAERRQAMGAASSGRACATRHGPGDRRRHPAARPRRHAHRVLSGRVSLHPSPLPVPLRPEGAERGRRRRYLRSLSSLGRRGPG